MRLSRSCAASVFAAAAFFATGCVETMEQARFGREVEVVFPIGDASGLAVRGENGAVDLSESAREDVLVRAKIRAVSQERADGVEITAASAPDGWLEIGAVWPTERTPNESVSFAVEAPGGRRVRALSSNGDIAIAGFETGAEAGTSNGRITVQGHEGAVQAKTSNGSVTVLGAAGPTEVRTSNGRVRIELADACVGPVTVKTSNGSVTLLVGPQFTGTIDADTSNGRVSVAGGPVRLLRDGPSSRLLQIGDGETLSTIDTSNGSVTIEVRD